LSGGYRGEITPVRCLFSARLLEDPAYLIFGSLLVAEHVSEIFLFDTPGWRAAAAAIYRALA
jgi:hypothetical protein